MDKVVEPVIDSGANEENLNIPHSQLHKRKFALIPLAEITPNLVHPVFKKTITQLLQECEDSLNIKKL